MTQKKKKSTAANNLIESLMDDLRDVDGSSISGVQGAPSGGADSEFTGPALLNLQVSPQPADPDKTIALKSVSTSAASAESAKPADSNNNSNKDSNKDKMEKAFSSQQQKKSALSGLDDGSSGEQTADSRPLSRPEPMAQLLKKDVFQLGSREAPLEPEVKVSFGIARSNPQAKGSSTENHLQRAESLSLAQNRILELETQLDQVRAENDQLSSSMDVARSRLEDATAKLSLFEKNKIESKEQAAIEQAMFRENIQAREYQVDRLKQKVEELEGRLQTDMKKIRVRERELENRLELSKAEKNALVRAKDEAILELKRKIEIMSSELEDSTIKCQELALKIEMNQEQFSRTVRALRLALTNLESHESTSSVNLSSAKKAE